MFPRQLQSRWHWIREGEFPQRYWCLHYVPICKVAALVARYEKLCARCPEEAREVRVVLEEAYDELHAARVFLDQ